MRARELNISTFRNIENEKITFSPSITFLQGDNAQGKTNALEALYLFARGKSFRGAKDAELCSFDKEGYSLSLFYEKEDREESLSVTVRGREKERRRNGILLTKQSEMVGSFRAVLFCPDHLQMVKGAPTERRKFLDIAISQCYPVYLSIYSQYIKNLEERNALLRAAQKGIYYDEQMIAVYSERLASLAAEIYFYRLTYLEKIKDCAKEVVKELSSGREGLSLFYRSDMGEEPLSKKEAAEKYRAVFEKDLLRERAAGMTLFGVQKDELGIYLGGISAKDYGSQGQQRSIVLALKMAEGIVAGEICGERPVYLFDDVLSELDEGRRRFLLSGMKDCQFIVTGCERSVLGEIGKNVKVIAVKNGKFTE